MSDQNPPNSSAWQPAGPVEQTPPPPPAAGAIPPPPTQQAWTSPPPPGTPPPAGFNPTPVGTGRVYRRRGLRGNGIYSMVVGIISILVPIVSLFIMGNGHFTFLVILPVLGLVYGIISVVQGNRRGFGIAGIVLCAVALLLEALLLL